MSMCIGRLIKGTSNTDIACEINDLSFKVPNDRKYFLALDQSTSCVGVYLTDTSFSFHLLLELHRQSTDKEEFFRQLKYFLIRLTDGLDIGLFVMEDVPNTDNKYTKKVLLDLKRRLQKWEKDIPALKRAERGDILPQVWRSAIVDKTKGTGRARSKKCNAEDLCDRFPELRKYLDEYLGSGFDCFDAACILHGYLLTRFNNDGERLIMAPLTGRYVHAAYYVPVTDVEYMQNMLQRLQQLCPDMLICKWNTNYHIRDNYRMAVNMGPVVVTEIMDERLKLRLLFEYDIPMDTYTLCIIIRRASVSAEVKKLIQVMSGNRVETL